MEATRPNAAAGSGENSDSRVDHEGLETADALGDQPVHVLLRPGYHPAPERHVTCDGRPRRGPLLVQGGDGDGRRDRVEGHVDDRCRAAGDRGSGGGGETLPLRPSRLVDVDVAVDEAGEDDQVTEVDVGGAITDLDDRAALVSDGGGTNLSVDDHSTAAQGGHESQPNRRGRSRAASCVHGYVRIGAWSR